MGRPRRADILYFSARLKAALRAAPPARGLVVEAPSGHGKTTLVQSCLREQVPEGQAWVRHVCAEESPRAAWRRFGQALQKIDAQAAKRLLALGPPDEDSVGDAASILREISCPEPGWLILDDFHRLAPLAPVFVWRALLEHESPNLRVSFVTRPLEASLLPYGKAG
jgi:ATP/maltotriose-dependent transcriptional regulator MalT